MMKLDDDHGDDDDHKMLIKCFTFGKEEREKRNGLKAKVYLIRPFCFGD